MQRSSHRGHRLTLAATILVTSTLGSAHAAPDTTRLERVHSAAVGKTRQAEGDLASRQAALVATRARRDATRARYRLALDDVRARLRAAYVSGTPDPLVIALTGDPAQAFAGAELARAVAAADHRALVALRDAVSDLDAAEADLALRKRAAAAQARLAQARATITGRRLERARAAERPRATLPVAAPRVGPRAGRGLAADIIAARSLPGDAPIDAASGQPLRFDLPTVAPTPLTARPGRAAREVRGRNVLVTIAPYRSPPQRTASGETYHPGVASAASRTLPLGTRVRLYLAGRTVTVRVNDRGPYTGGADLALSAVAVSRLGLRSTARVRAEVFDRP